MAFILILIVAFLLSLSVHEMAHAFVADRLGDPTARLEGRVTLNPIAHLDPIGTLLPLVLLLTGSPLVFGWGKPVPFDPYNLRSPRRDAALISVAGPAANIILAIILAVLIRASHLFLGVSAYNIEIFLTPILVMNINWALFNLLPVHPLDGGKVLVGLLPSDLAEKVDETLHQFGTILLIFLIFPFFGFSVASSVIAPITRLLLAILLPGAPLI